MRRWCGIQYNIYVCLSVCLSVCLCACFSLIYVHQLVQHQHLTILKAPDPERKDMLRKRLYPLVQQELKKRDALGCERKITGMLLDGVETPKLLQLLYSPATLKKKVAEAHGVLKEVGCCLSLSSSSSSSSLLLVVVLVVWWWQWRWFGGWCLSWLCRSIWFLLCSWLCSCLCPWLCSWRCSWVLTLAFLALPCRWVLLLGWHWPLFVFGFAPTPVPILLCMLRPSWHGCFAPMCCLPSLSCTTDSVLFVRAGQQAISRVPRPMSHAPCRVMWYCIHF